MYNHFKKQSILNKQGVTMIDKIKLRIDGRNDALAERLEGVTELTSAETGEQLKVSGWYKGLKVDIGNSTRIEGSLTRYHTGTNAACLRWRDLQGAILNLSDDFNIQPEAATLEYMEVGSTFAMNRPPVEYLAELGHLGRFSRENRGRGSTIYYKQGTPLKSLCFYDKGKEMGKRGEAFPMGVENLLRYELRLRGQGIVQTLRDRRFSVLQDREAYKSLLIRWQNYYNDIQKVAKERKGGGGKADLLLGYISQMHQIHHIYSGEFDKYIVEATRGSTNGSRYRKELAGAIAKRGSTELTEELTERIKEAVEYNC